MMKFIAPFIFCSLLLVSFREDDNADYAKKAGEFYDSISYYPDGSPMYMSYMEVDSSRINVWYTDEGRIAWYSRKSKLEHYYSTYLHYAPDGRMIYDSSHYGWETKVKRYDSLGLCNDYRVYHRYYGMKWFGVYLQHFLIDDNGKVSRYIKSDSVGNILGDYHYPLAYLDNLKSYRETYNDKKTKEMGFGLPAEGTDSVVKCGLWQTYYPNGKIESIGLFFNGIPDGLFCIYDTIGKPQDWNYYTGGIRDADMEMHIRLDTLDTDGLETRWIFRYDGKEYIEGPDIAIQKNGRVRQFIYWYKGNSIRGADERGSDFYLDGGTQFVPAIMGSRDRFGIEYEIVGNERDIKKRSCEPFLTEEYCTSYNRRQKIGLRKTLRGYFGEHCDHGSFGYMFTLTDSINKLHVNDSCKRHNDTTYFYSGGKVVVRKVDGPGSYSDWYYEFADKDFVWHKQFAKEVREQYVLLPNAKWFQILNVNMVPPGLYESRINGNTVYRSFRSGVQKHDGWEYAWYPSGQMRRKEYYKDGKRCGNYKEWDDQGRLTERGHFDSDGKRTGVVKKFDRRGKTSRYRTIHGKCFGLRYEKHCGCLSLDKSRNKPCRSFYWNNMKLFRLNIICKRRPSPFD